MRIRSHSSQQLENRHLHYAARQRPASLLWTSLIVSISCYGWEDSEDEQQQQQRTYAPETCAWVRGRESGLSRLATLSPAWCAAGRVTSRCCNG